MVVVIVCGGGCMYIYIYIYTCLFVCVDIIQ